MGGPTQELEACDLTNIFYFFSGAVFKIEAGVLYFNSPGDRPNYVSIA